MVSKVAGFSGFLTRLCSCVPALSGVLSRSGVPAVIVAAVVTAGLTSATHAQGLEEGWANPTGNARLRAYWWWLNGNVDKAAITRDLEEMKAKGFGGALICDADGSSQDGNERAPHGPTFFSAEWRELYKHCLREADRLGLEMSLNIQSGWNLGGPMVTAEDAPKKLAWTETEVAGGSNLVCALPKPKAREGFYRDLFVLAFPVKAGPGAGTRKPLQNLQEKALLRALRPFSAPDSSPLFQEDAASPGEEDVRVAEVRDISRAFGKDGVLRWEAPAGAWQVIRVGYTLNDHCKVSTCSQGWDGYALDPFDAGAFKRYWNAVVEPLIADAGPHAGKALKYLHTDSWEVEVANWTPTLREEFRKRRGYDPLPWLPVIAGKIVNSREESNRFLADYRRTMGDLAIDNHYRLFKEGAHRHGLLIHPESGGPHAVPIDAQQCLGFDDAPMSEFWAWSWRHRVGDENRFFVKQPASAAHVYGHKLVLAEGFTTIGPHWQETLWDNLKPSFDHACTEGLNLLVWHAFVCSPESAGMPGQQYFAGTHLNPNVTWWEKSKPFFSYINRCQWMLQQGLFVADVAYYYGDHVPNFTQLRRSDPAGVGAGYDYDVLTAEAILERATVKNGRITLPDGMSYAVLVLPDRDQISLPVLEKVARLAEGGATIVGRRPVKASSMRDYPACDEKVRVLAERLWGTADSSGAEGKARSGRVVSGKRAREVLLESGVKPDFDFNATGGAALTYIHRRAADAEIYFVANRTNVPVSAECTFRVSGRTPEVWDPVSGERRAVKYAAGDGRTSVRLDFHECGSVFVVFREGGGATAPKETTTEPATMLKEIKGPWTVSFDPKWGGPATATFETLESWTKRPEEGIKYYSGTAVYRTSFDMGDGSRQKKVYLDLGRVRELAEVRVNGESCGIVWAPPFRVEIGKALRSGRNVLEVEVVNFWPNRIIGDAVSKGAKGFTKTNVRKLTSDEQLMESGLLGPVVVRQEGGGKF